MAGMHEGDGMAMSVRAGLLKRVYGEVGGGGGRERQGQAQGRLEEPIIVVRCARQTPTFLDLPNWTRS